MFMAGLSKAILALRPSDFAWAFGRAEARERAGITAQRPQAKARGYQSGPSGLFV